MCMGRALIIVDNCWAIFEQLVIINGYCVRVHEIERCSMASMENLWSVQGSPCRIREPLYITFLIGNCKLVVFFDVFTIYTTNSNSLTSFGRTRTKTSNVLACFHWMR